MAFSAMPTTQASPKKEFRIEKLLKNRSALGAVSIDEAIDADGATAMLISQVQSLHDKFDSLQSEAQFGGPGGDDVDLRIEITRLVKEIGKTKAELATLRHPMAEEDQDKIVSATNELDAIVEATEGATTEILRSSEEINELLEKFRGDSDLDEEHAAAIDMIEGRVIAILEACNFQDITGQRINKVVNTMKFIEERVKAMIEIWGVDAFAELPVPEIEHEDEDAALLAGPQLEHQGLTQDDIDAMFD